MLNNIYQTILTYKDELIKMDLWHRYLDFVSNLTSREILIITIVVAVLILIMAYRKLGIGAVFGLCLIYFFVYMIFHSNIFTNWQKDKDEENRRMQIYNVELNKQ